MKIEDVGCIGCAHTIKGGCKAFPKGIPMPFASGDLLHESVVRGQAGDFVWQPRDQDQESSIDA